MKTWKKALCAMLSIVMLTMCLAGCGSKEPDPVNANTGSFDEMVAYLTAKGYIAEDAVPVDINTTAGYHVDNVGEFPVVVWADVAKDYDGLWLFWWDIENPTENYETVKYIMFNNGMLVYQGGAAVLETAATKGAFAIAFAEDYEHADAVLAAFYDLPSE